MRTVNFLSLNAADASQATSNGTPVDGQSVFAASCQVIASGAPVGVVKFQASNDLPPANNAGNQFSPANWTDVTGLTVSVSAAGSFLIPKFDCAYRWIRPVYTKTSGTGAITAEVCALAY